MRLGRLKPAPKRGPAPKPFQCKALIERYCTHRFPNGIHRAFHTPNGARDAIQFLHGNFSKPTGLAIALHCKPASAAEHNTLWDAAEIEFPTLLDVLSTHIASTYRALKNARHRDTLRICATLAHSGKNDGNQFFLACGDLAKRLHVGSQPAARCLAKLMSVNAIRIVSEGTRKSHPKDRLATLYALQSTVIKDT